MSLAVQYFCELAFRHWRRVTKEPKMFAAYDKKANGHFRAGNGKASVPLGKRNSSPKQIIPFDDAEVSDF